MIGVHANCDKLLSNSETGVKILHCTITSPKWKVTQMAEQDKEIDIRRILWERNHLPEQQRRKYSDL